MNIKVGLLEPQQETTIPPEELWSREERQQRAEHIQREKKLNVNTAFRVENIKNYLSQRSSITSDRFIIETVKQGLKIDFRSKPAIKTFFKWLNLRRKVKSFLEN